MDLDQSGHSWQRTRVYLGPSLGWVETQVLPTRDITAGGTYQIQPGDSVILVNTAAPVTLILPDVRLWTQQPAYQPASGFQRGIWVKDLGGNAGSNPITLQPFTGQSIDLLTAPQVINQAYALFGVFPLNNLTGWYSSRITAGGGGGGGIPEAPTDGKLYGRQSAGWSPVTADVTLAGINVFTGSQDAFPYSAFSLYAGPAGAITGKIGFDLTGVTGAWTFKLPNQSGNLALINAPAVTAQPLDDDLTAISGLTGTSTIYYRSGAGAWSAVTIGTGLSFSGGTLSSTSAGGSVNTSGPVTSSMLAGYVDSTGNLIKGVSIGGGLTYASNTLAADPDLISLAAASASGAGPTPSGLYYRKAADTWAPLNLSGISINAGTDTLTVTATGGGDVYLANNNPFTGANTFNNTKTVFGSATSDATTPETVVVQGSLSSNRWSNDAVGSTFALRKSRGVPVGTQAAVQANDAIGGIYFQGSYGTAFQAGAVIQAVAVAAPIASAIPTDLRFSTTNLAGTGAIRMGLTSEGYLVLGNPTGASITTSKLEIDGTSAAPSTHEQGQYSADSTPPFLYLDKSRGTTIGAYANLVNNDAIGNIQWRGSDATGFRPGPYISVIATGPVIGSTPKQPGDIYLGAVNSAGQAVNALVVRGSGCDIMGVNDGRACPVGGIGELYAQAGSGVSIPSGSWVTMTSFILPAGDWDIWGSLALGPGAGPNGGTFACLIGTVANSAGGQYFYNGGYFSSAGELYFGTQQAAVRLTTATTVYFNMGNLSTTVTVPSGTASVITARRRR